MKEVEKKYENNSLRKKYFNSLANSREGRILKEKIGIIKIFPKNS
jgi:hypothetical protein